MAANIPAKLRAADLTRFCVRAAQLETAKPVVAYWCEYWIANQILTRGLHTGDDETLQYTTGLMDKLEQIKAENATNDAIMDDMAGQAYVEQFASETLDRADRAVHANKVTRQTADTFQAAATFFELVNIWGPPDGETQNKIKYAKFHAVRIARALKEGKDPNESNPKPEPTEETLPAVDYRDLDVGSTNVPDRSRQPTVQEVPDEQDQFNGYVAPQPSASQFIHPSARASSGSPAPSKQDVSPRDEFPHTDIHEENVSPLEPPQSNDRTGSVGGGFFPLPTFTAESNDYTLPTAPPTDVDDLGLPNQPSFAPGSRISFPGDANDLELPDQPSFAPDSRTASPGGGNDLGLPSQPSFTPGSRAAPDFQPPPPSNIPFNPMPPMPPMPRRVPQVPQNTHYPPPPVQSEPIVSNVIEVDDEAMAQAQKHARWAISALNFEDTQTAIKELREALKKLGART